MDLLTSKHPHAALVAMQQSSLRCPPCRRPRPPGMNPLFPLRPPPPPLPLLPQPPPHLAPLNRPISLSLPLHHFNSDLAFTTKSLDPRAGPLRTHAQSALAVCDRLLQCILLSMRLRAAWISLDVSAGLVHDTWSYAASLLLSLVWVLVCYGLPLTWSSGSSAVWCPRRPLRQRVMVPYAP